MNGLLVSKILAVLLLYIGCFHNAIAQDRSLEIAYEYYSNGEYEKSIEIFEKIIKKNNHTSKIHKYYLDALLKTNNEKVAAKYLKKQVKSEPLNPVYNIDYGVYLMQYEDSITAAKYLNEYVNNIAKDQSQLRYAALYFTDVKLYGFAEKSYRMGQKNSREFFYYDLAELYDVWGKTEEMITQYMKMLEVDETQQEYVENILQDKLSEEDFDVLEGVLVKYVQKNPDKLVFNEMLLWYLLQKKQFYRAFIQAKAIDKRRRLEGFKVLEIGRLSVNNEAYADAIKIFQYLVDKYNNRPVYPIAKRMLIQSKEELVKNTYPVDIEKIKSLAKDYENIIQEIGIRASTADAVRNMALLQAFYLNNKDTSIVILESLIARGGIPRAIVSQAKLDLGDIYLLKDEPWEATLLYSQVEKAEKERRLGHEAKLKNAKLSYYTGNFELAAAHLDILKLATSREISNDAMDLSLLIQDNLNLDTTTVVMEQYANVDLLIFQGRYKEALGIYDEMLSTYSQHSLIDEVLWEKGNILLKLGHFEEVVVTLKKILEKYPNDILADDANFLIGKVYEENLQKLEEAQEYYRKQLADYPGSVHNVEARKRFRKLRGDKIN